MADRKPKKPRGPLDDTFIRPYRNKRVRVKIEAELDADWVTKDGVLQLRLAQTGILKIVPRSSRE